MSAPEPWDALCASCHAIAVAAPELGAGLDDVRHGPGAALAGLLGRVLQPTWLSADALVALARAEFEAAPDLVAIALDDLSAIGGRNLETGDTGAAWTWIGHRGFHILLAHRLVHTLWTTARQTLALAVKAGAGPLGADIHPAARIGRRVFLDHGVGVVVGETAVIEDDVSLWHGVTLGSTLMQDGDRHPKIRRAAVLGAGATILGNIVIGEGAVVAAGSIVLQPVPPFTLVAGQPAMPRPGYRHPFGYLPQETP